jgi:hypothetical protein
MGLQQWWWMGFGQTCDGPGAIPGPVTSQTNEN